MMADYLYIGNTKRKGRGIFTSEAIPQDKIIEVAPVIVLNQEDTAKVGETKLYNYLFEWGADKKSGAVALGYASLYNHSYTANCEYEMDYDEKLMYFKTVRDIEAGEELTINYNADWDDDTPIWFDAVE